MERIETENGTYVALFSDGKLTGEAPTLIRASAKQGHDFLYGDAIHADTKGAEHPVYRPVYSPDTLLSHPYIGSPVILSERLYRALGSPVREDADALYALALRAAAKTGKAHHIPHTLFVGKQPPPCCTKRIVSDTLPLFFRTGAVHEGLFIGSFSVRYGLPKRPLVSVIVGATGEVQSLRRTLEAIEGENSYLSYELIVADGLLREKPVQQYYAALQKSKAATVLHRAGEKNLPKLFNEAARMAHGELLLFLRAGIVPERFDAIERLVEQAMQTHTAAVGAKILFADGRLLQAGLVLGLADLPVSLYAGKRDSILDPDQNRMTNCVRNVSAVSEVYMVDAEAFFAAGGFDETFETIGFEAALCVCLAALGRRTVYTPYARFLALSPIGNRRDTSKANLDRCTDLFRPMHIHGDPMLSENPDFLRTQKISDPTELFL